MCVPIQADSAAGVGVSDTLGCLTESLKSEFKDILCEIFATILSDFEGILCDTIATPESLDFETKVQHAADLCAEKCRQQLSRRINGDTLPASAVKTLETPSWSVNKDVAGSDCSSCAFFDLTSADSPNDVETLVRSSGFDAGVNQDSIEFMYGEALVTINFRDIPDDFCALRQDIRGLQDLRDFTAQDLHTLFQDMQGLREALKDAKGNLQSMHEEFSLACSAACRLKEAVTNTKGNLQLMNDKSSFFCSARCSRQIHEDSSLISTTGYPTLHKSVEDVLVKPSCMQCFDSPRNSIAPNHGNWQSSQALSSKARLESLETSQLSRRSQIARSQGKKQWVAAKSPGVFGDIGERMRSKLLAHQDRAKALPHVSIRPRRHSTGDGAVQMYLSNVSKMGGKIALKS